jgi:hypothetical protein
MTLTTKLNATTKTLDELKGLYADLFNELSGLKNNQLNQGEIVAKLKTVDHAIKTRALLCHL